MNLKGFNLGIRELWYGLTSNIIFFIILNKAFNIWENTIAMKQYYTWTLSFVLGSIVLCIFSFLQKMMLGIPLSLKNFIVPFFIGGGLGLLAGIRHYRVIKLKEDLQKAYDNLEIKINDRTAELSKINEQMLREIEERKQSQEVLREREQRIEHLNRVLAAIHNISRLITREKDRDRMLDEACRLLVDTHGFYNAWIILVEDDRPIEPFFHTGFEGGFAPMTERLLAKDIPNCARLVLNEGGVHVMENPISKCTDCPFATNYTDRAGMIVRLEHDGRVFGWLTVSVPLKYAHDNEERDLLSEVADDISLAVWSLGMKVRQQSLEQKYTAVLSTTSDAVITSDLEGNITLFNPGAEQLFRCSEEDALGSPIMRFTPDDRRSEQVDLLRKVRKTGSVQGIKTERLTTDGQRVFVEITLNLQTGQGRPVGFSAILRDITERKRADEALQESKEHLLSVLRAAPTGIGVVVDRVIKQVNERMCEMVGYSEDELIGQNARYIYPSDEEFQNVGREKYAQIQKKGTGTVETRFQRKDGKVINVLLSSTPINLDDLSAGVTFTALDITERKLAEKALRESEEKYRSMMEAMNDAAYICSSDFRVEYMNPAMIKMTGSDAIGRLCHKVIYGLDEKCSWCIHEKIMKGEHNKTEFVTLEDGNTYHISSSPIFHTDGSVSKMSIYHDITVQRQVEENYRMLFREMQASIILHETIFDAQGMPVDYRFMAFNPAFDRITGMKGEDIVGKTVLEVFPDIEPYWIEAYKKVAVTGEPVYLENYSEELDRHLQMTVFRPTPYQLASASIDITDRKNMEKRLQQSQKMEAIGTLAGGIAHDFNNILFPIVGYTEMMLDDLPEDSPFRNNVKEIFQGTMRAGDLVKQILAFSRQSDQNPKPLKVQPIVREVLKLIRSSLPTTIEIKQHISNKCGLVTADATQIHQVAMNLMTNAFHAMEDEGGELEVTLKEVELGIDDLTDPSMTPGAYVCLTVADTGPGIDQSVISRIFEPYYTTKGEGKGTGLGLAVVHGIVKNYEGDIRVYSEPGMGTAFHVYLPVIKSRVETEEANAVAQVPGGTERILLVDDEDPIVRMEKQMLERLGYNVTIRTSSIEALEAFRSAPDKFDLVITDMTMPNMTGVQLSQKLLEIRPDIPIIICTGFSTGIDEAKATAAGIRGFVMKPVVKSEVAKKIREVLDQE
jgi:PAS domain S-box-containing protein